jgi:caffeoyl-CoA O-methyltransferase
VIPIVDPAVEAYVEAHASPPPEHLARLAAQTRARLERPQMLTGTVEGRLLEALVWATSARRVLELGTYSGYSALSMAAALPAGGEVITCESSDEHADFAQRHIDATPYRDRIRIVRGPALESLGSLDGPFDLVFVDADKANYVNYYEAVLPKLAERGLMAVDNTLWSGRVADPSVDDDTTRSLRAFNDHVLADERVVSTILSVRDGITLIRWASA